MIIMVESRVAFPFLEKFDCIRIPYTAKETARTFYRSHCRIFYAFFPLTINICCLLDINVVRAYDTMT